MKKIILFIIPLAILSLALKSDKLTYQLYAQNGKAIKYSKMMKTLEEADIIMFGELHNNPICHWLELEITKDIYKNNPEHLVLGAEMFERDDQLVIDEYFSDFYKTKKFEAEVKLWNNYSTDYKPLLEFAKNNDLKFIATNVPRRYASIVHKKGLEELEKLPEASKAYIAKLPIEYNGELKAYKEMMEMMKSMKHANENMPKAQAIKDATMAYSILENFKDGDQFIHYHGTYHSNNFEGIVWYLKQARPDLNIVTIASVEQTDIGTFSEDDKDLANFILVVDEDMTKTY